MAQEDTEQQLVTEMTAIIRRAIALGDKTGSQRTTERILRAASGVDTSLSASPSAEPPKPPPGPPDEAPPPKGEKPGGGRRYPYGYVASALEETLKAHPQGIERSSIKHYCKVAFDKDIDDESIRNSLKQFKRSGRARTRGSKVFWAAHLEQAGKENGAPSGAPS